MSILRFLRVLGPTARLPKNLGCVGQGPRKPWLKGNRTCLKRLQQITRSCAIVFQKGQAKTSYENENRNHRIGTIDVRQAPKTPQARTPPPRNESKRVVGVPLRLGAGHQLPRLLCGKLASGCWEQPPSKPRICQVRVYLLPVTVLCVALGSY